MSERKRIKAYFRCGRVLEVPCNWNVSGRCGEDTKPCEVINIVEENENV